MPHRLQGYGIIPLIRIGFNKRCPCPAAPGPSSVCVSWGTPLWSSPGYTDRACSESPTRALLWEAGVHPALGPPSGTVTIGAVFPLRLQAFPPNRLDAFAKTEGMIEGMIKGVLTLNATPLQSTNGNKEICVSSAIDLPGYS